MFDHRLQISGLEPPWWWKWKYDHTFPVFWHKASFFSSQFVFLFILSKTSFFFLPVIHLFHIPYFLHLAFFNDLKRKSMSVKCWTFYRIKYLHTVTRGRKLYLFKKSLTIKTTTKKHLYMVAKTIYDYYLNVVVASLQKKQWKIPE